MKDPHQNEIRCVLCDVTMPRMGGWDTLAALRQLAPGLPVILASGHSEAQVMGVTHLEQPDAFLHKPFEVSTLLATIDHVLAKRGG